MTRLLIIILLSTMLYAGVTSGVVTAGLATIVGIVLFFMLPGVGRLGKLLWGFLQIMHALGG